VWQCENVVWECLKPKPVCRLLEKAEFILIALANYEVLRKIKIKTNRKLRKSQRGLSLVSSARNSIQAIQFLRFYVCGSYISLCCVWVFPSCSIFRWFLVGRKGLGGKSGGLPNYSVKFSCFIAIFSIFFHNLLRLFVCHLSSHTNCESKTSKTNGN